MRKLIVSSALALIAIAGITGTARADDYNGSCANVPASVDGNIFLSEPDCEIDHAISATGDIVFNYGTVSAKGMTAGGHIDLNTTSFTGDGNISAQGYVRIRSENDIAIDGDVATVTAGSVRLEASGNVSVNNVTSAPDSHIIIYSNYNTGNSGKFYIGGSGHSNGINGTATSEYALYVYNGFGGIEVVDPTKITVRALLLNALDDAIKISSGLLSTDAYNDGTIQLLADSIEFESGAILSSKNSDSSGQVHGIALNAKNITYDGDLTLNADGDGTSGRHGYVYFFTKGSTTINLLGSIYNPFIDIDNTNAVVDELTVTGTGSGTLNVTANGNYMDVVLQGYPIAFNTAGDINMFAKASVDHGIYVRNLNNRNDQAGVAFAGSTGKVMLDASGDGGNGGTVEISADNILLDQDRFDIKVDGPEGGSGNGGTINLSGTRIAQSQTKSAFSANGAGSGNGGLILIAPGESNLNVGENLADAGSVGVVYLAAKGGDTSGNGGLVKVYDMTGDLTVNGSKADTRAIDVSVAGPTGDGGTIDLQIDGDILFKPKDAEGDAGFVANSGITDGKGGSILLKAKGFESNDVSVKFQANGVDTGAGGTIDVQLEESLFIAYGIGAYSFEARNTDASADWLNGNADGGTIKITSEDELSLYGGALGVDGGHKGGNLLIKGDSLSISGNFYANGGAQGDGGQIRFESNSLTWQDENENTTISADGYGEGDGGLIELLFIGSQRVVLNNGASAFNLQANGGESGNGGTIRVEANGDLDAVSDYMLVQSGETGNGGNIALEGDEVQVSSSLYVDGGLQGGSGGTISIKANTLILPNGQFGEPFIFSANSNGEDVGGSIYLNASQIKDEVLQDRELHLQAKSISGNGGKIEIESSEDINLTAEEIDVSAGVESGGKGGSVVIKSAKDVSVDTTIQTNGGCDNGAGGSIFIEGNSISLSEGISASGGGSDNTCIAFTRSFSSQDADGGTITIVQKSQSELLDLSDLDIRANSGLRGKGGAIFISASNVSLQNTALYANGGEDSEGGDIEIKGINQNEEIDIADTIIEAKGGTNGFGGNVILHNVQNWENPNSPVDVIAISPNTSGSTLGGKHHGQMQSIRGNVNVICRFIPAQNASSWPAGYYNCANPLTPTALDDSPLAAASLINSPSAVTEFNHVLLRVWNTFAEYKIFTNSPEVDIGKAGLTDDLRAVSPNQNIIVEIFEKPTSLPQTLTVDQIKEVTAHELGHAIDYLRNTQSQSSVYFDDVVSDYEELDYDLRFDTPLTSHRRLPCEPSVYDQKSAPFAMVRDNDGVLICDAFGNLNSKWKDTNGLAYRNSYILRAITPYFTGAQNNPPGFLDPTEPWAQAFAFQLFVNGIDDNLSIARTYNGVLNRGYFSCGKRWADALRNGLSTRPNALTMNSCVHKSWYVDSTHQRLGRKDTDN